MILASKIVMLFLPILFLASPALTEPLSGNLQLRSFSCPQPYGFYKYTDRCDEYVECKYYVPLALTCPVGLHFNPRADWTEYPCDVPSKVQCNVPITTAFTTTTPPPTLPPATLPPPTLPPPPTKAVPENIARTDFWCPQQYGYFKYTDQCDQYVECKNYVPRKYACPAGLDFNPNARWTEYPCDQPSRVQCDREPEILTTTTTTTTTTTPPPPTSTYVAPDVIAPHDFSCPQPHGYFRQTEQCGEYIECKNYVPRTYACPAGHDFNPDVEWTEYPCKRSSRVQCDREPDVPITSTTTTTTTTTTPAPTTPAPAKILPHDFSCPQQHGYFKHTKQCSEYVECKNYIPRTFTCPADLHFNPDVKWTDYPCHHPSKAQCYK